MMPSRASKSLVSVIKSKEAMGFKPVTTKVSNQSEPKVLVLSKTFQETNEKEKEDLASSMQRELMRTRSALLTCCSVDGCFDQNSEAIPNKEQLGSACSSGNSHMACTFGALFEKTDGQIAYLTRVLQNLKEHDEIWFQPECLFAGIHDQERIELHDKFWTRDYQITNKNVYHQSSRNDSANPTFQRKGRSYAQENLQTIHQTSCNICHEIVPWDQRITIRGKVYHMACVHCAQCGASLRRKVDFISFDGSILCSTACIQRYDAAHVKQQRK